MLVILIMVTLIVFGVLALMSSYADLKLARKSGEWVKGYYDLDGKGDVLVQQIDTFLKEAEMQAAGYMNNREYEKSSSSVVVPDIQNQINVYWSKNKGNQAAEEEYLDSAYHKLYFYIAAKKLEEAAPQYGYKLEYSQDILNNEQLFSNEYKLGDEDLLKVGALLLEGAGNSTQTLDILIEILGPSSPYSAKEASAQNTRYRIIKWKQLQNQFEYSNQLDLWNGEVNNQ